MDCIFCKIVDGQLPSHRIASDDSAVAFLDIEPFQEGHTLVVPRRHVDSALSDDGELARAVPLVEQVASTLTKRLGASGVNIVTNAGEVAGQTVHHLHIHVIPRYDAEVGFDAMRSQRPQRPVEEIAAALTSTM